MFPQHLGVAPGLCDVPPARLALDFPKPVTALRPLRHPQPAHTHGPRLGHLDYPANPVDGRFHPLSLLPVSPNTSSGPAVAVPSPVLPYPVMPFPGLPLGTPAQELQQMNLLQALQGTPGPAEPHKIKTPINRNYLELAMLVCNTFRGKLFPCPHCRYVTDRRNNLKRHISTMHQTCEKLLECCGVSFSTKASLREHIMIFHHNGYSCPYCGRRFCRKALLKRHLSVHSGQKDYTCPSCDYATSHKSNLERHKRIHERLKLGEDGSLFECGDFTTHQMTQSPDTTDNSCIDPKDDSFIDIESTDDNSDIDVTEDNSSDSERLRNYPIIMPNKTRTSSTDLKQSECSSYKEPPSADVGSRHVLCGTVSEGDLPSYDQPQNMAIDFSKSNYNERKSRRVCTTVLHPDEGQDSTTVNVDSSETVIGRSESNSTSLTVQNVLR